MSDASRSGGLGAAESVVRSESTLRAIHEITTAPDLGVAEQIREILGVGCRQFGTAFGAVARVVGEQLRFDYIVCPSNEIAEGTSMERADTFCNEVLVSDRPICLHDAGEPEWSNHPARRNLGLQCYLGSPIRVDGTPWGTVCFFDYTSRPKAFTDTDLELLGLIAKRIEVGIQHDSLLQGFRAVLKGTAGVTGKGFFRSMIGELSRVLDADLAFVAECAEDSSRATTLAVWENGEPGENFCYDTRQTPCEGIVDDGIRHFPDDVQALFPFDRGLVERGVRGYVGISIMSYTGRKLGHLVAVRQRPLELKLEDRWLLEIFAARAGAELERLLAEREQRRLEQEVFHTEKLKSLGVLAGGIAHDFNNLLTGILGNASLALKSIPEDSAAYGKLRQVQHAAHRAESLTKQMLAYSGRGAFVIEALDLNSLSEEMAELLESAVSKTAEFERILAPDLPPIEADADQLRQVIMNLIMNASDALEGRPGHITLRTGVCRPTPDDAETFTVGDVIEPGRYVYVEVEDTGVGMDGKTRSRMFDPFFSTKFSGRGLGLAAVLGIVKGHGGGIAVDSEPGKGTRVRVVFPVSTRQPVAPEPEKPVVEALPAELHGTVLIVDDEDLVREVSANVLRDSGLEVLTARDGVEAVEIFRRDHERIGIVLLDLTMPRMDGCTAARKMHEIAPETPVLLVSGFDENAAMLRFADSSLAGFIQKPFELEDLVDRVRMILDR